jgi:hypothetical protein
MNYQAKSHCCFGLRLFDRDKYLARPCREFIRVIQYFGGTFVDFSSTRSLSIDSFEDASIQAPNFITLDGDSLIMGDDDGGQFPFRMKLAKHAKYDFSRLVVQIACRFVCQHQFRLSYQGPGNRHSLLLPS